MAKETLGSQQIVGMFLQTHNFSVNLNLKVSCLYLCGLLRAEL